jgi:hypothetical protein
MQYIRENARPIILRVIVAAAVVMLAKSFLSGDLWSFLRTALALYGLAIASIISALLWTAFVPEHLFHHDHHPAES